MVDDPKNQPAAPSQALQKLDIADAPVVDPTRIKSDEEVQKAGNEISGIQKAGVQLANRVIWVIATALVILTLLVTMSELAPSSDVSGLNKLVIDVHARATALPASSPELPEVRKDLQELARQIADAKQAQRSFWMQFSQMILLNLLLPVLTAILGYVFGANNASTTDSK